jgi:hypothetical protein
MKIRSVRIELCHADRGTDRRTDMIELIFAFRNLVRIPKNSFRTSQ